VTRCNGCKSNASSPLILSLFRSKSLGEVTPELSRQLRDAPGLGGRQLIEHIRQQTAEMEQELEPLDAWRDPAVRSDQSVHYNPNRFEHII
jgi:hypothetical protein